MFIVQVQSTQHIQDPASSNPDKLNNVRIVRMCTATHHVKVLEYTTVVHITF